MSWCNPRHRATVNANREFIAAYKMKTGCSQCRRLPKNRRELRKFHFHHLRKIEKFMNVTAMVSGGYSLRTILAEISKCTLLCETCHQVGDPTGKHAEYCPPVGRADEYREPPF